MSETFNPADPERIIDHIVGLGCAVIATFGRNGSPMSLFRFPKGTVPVNTVRLECERLSEKNSKWDEDDVVVIAESHLR